jgi:hypothetical protein
MKLAVLSVILFTSLVELANSVAIAQRGLSSGQSADRPSAPSNTRHRRQGSLSRLHRTGAGDIHREGPERRPLVSRNHNSMVTGVPAAGEHSRKTD